MPHAPTKPHSSLDLSVHGWALFHYVLSMECALFLSFIQLIFSEYLLCASPFAELWRCNWKQHKHNPCVHIPKVFLSSKPNQVYQWGTSLLFLAKVAFPSSMHLELSSCASTVEFTPFYSAFYLFVNGAFFLEFLERRACSTIQLCILHSI